MILLQNTLKFKFFQKSRAQIPKKYLIDKYFVNSEIALVTSIEYKYPNAEVTYIKDRYQKKICQEGTSAVWLLHFNVGAIFWQFKNKKIYHVWLVKNL